MEVAQGVPRKVCRTRLWFRMFRSVQDPYSHRGKDKSSDAGGGGGGSRCRPSQLCVHLFAGLCKYSAWQSFSVPELTGLPCQHLAFLGLCEKSQYKPTSRGSRPRAELEGFFSVESVAACTWQSSRDEDCVTVSIMSRVSHSTPPPRGLYNLAMKICSHWELGRKMMFLAQQPF